MNKDWWHSRPQSNSRGPYSYESEIVSCTWQCIYGTVRVSYARYARGRPTSTVLLHCYVCHIGGNRSRQHSIQVKHHDSSPNSHRSFTPCRTRGNPKPLSGVTDGWKADYHEKPSPTAKNRTNVARTHVPAGGVRQRKPFMENTTLPHSHIFRQLSIAVIITDPITPCPLDRTWNILSQQYAAPHLRAYYLP